MVGMVAMVWKCLNLSVFSSSYFCWLFYMQHSVVHACHFDTRRRCCVILSLDAFCSNYKLDHNQPNKQFDGQFEQNPKMKIIFDEHRGLLLPEQSRNKTSMIISLFKIILPFHRKLLLWICPDWRCLQPCVWVHCIDYTEH